MSYIISKCEVHTVLGQRFVICVYDIKYLFIIILFSEHFHLLLIYSTQTTTKLQKLAK